MDTTEKDFTEILEKAKSGDKAAQEHILKKYEPEIQKHVEEYVKEFGMNGIEDFRQNLVLSVLKAMYDFKPEEQEI